MNDLLLIGERLKKMRGEMSQASFAKMLGVKAPQYNRYETGKIKPPRKLLEQISEVKKISIDWILTGESIYNGLEERILELENMLSKCAEAGAIPKDSISNEEWAILKCLRILPDTFTNKILSIIVDQIKNLPNLYVSSFDIKKELLELKGIIFDRRPFNQGKDYEKMLLGSKKFLQGLEQGIIKPVKIK
ncbi:MAG: helix-turn-helix domain-containing protein [Pseudomonadota bacterium]